jgi:hypothetical protein
LLHWWKRLWQVQQAVLPTPEEAVEAVERFLQRESKP